MSLPAITQLVDDKMSAASLGAAYDTNARDRAIAQALVTYGEDAPQDLVAELAADGYRVPTPTDWVEGQSRLSAVEYPLDQVPMATQLASVRQGVSGQTIRLAESLGVAVVRMHFTAPHASDGSTVPAHHANAVACWAAGELCAQLATARAHDRDASIGAQVAGAPTESGELARRAKEWKAVYRVSLGLPDFTGSAAGAASGPVGQPAGTVTTWGPRRWRGRLSSLAG